MMFRTLIAAAVVAVASGQFCQVCGAGKVVTLPAAIFTPPGRDPVACGDLQTAGINGDPDVFSSCATIALLIPVTCGCADGTFAPTTAPDTDAPAAPMEPPVATVNPAGSLSPVTPAPVTPEPTAEPTAPPTAPPTTKAPTLGGTTIVGMKMKMMQKEPKVMKVKKVMLMKKEKLVKEGKK